MTEENTMIEFSSDVSSAEPPVPLPAGEYLATIKSAVVHVGQSGSKMARIEWYIPVEQYPVDYDQAEAPDGTIVTSWRPSLEDTTRGRFSVRTFCESIGAVASSSMDLNNWIGLEAVIETDVEEFEGIDRVQFKRVRPNV